jgi:hypothetical protein
MSRSWCSRIEYCGSQASRAERGALAGEGAACGGAGVAVVTRESYGTKPPRVNEGTGRRRGGVPGRARRPGSLQAAPRVDGRSRPAGTRSHPDELAEGVALGYRGRTMVRHKRAGRTVKISVSLDRDDLAVLRRRARESFGGNLSAAFSEAARWIRQREARRRLIDMLGGPTLTVRAAAAIDAEQQRRQEQPGKPRRKRAA